MARGNSTPQDEISKKVFSNNLNNLLAANNTTQAELHRVTKIPKSTLTGYVKGTSLPNAGNVQKIADFFGILKSELDPRFSNSIRKNDSAKIVSIYSQLDEKRQDKVVSYAEKQLEEQTKKTAFKVYGEVAAGPAIEYNDAEAETHYAESVPASADMALTINGDSMEPNFPNGSIVFYKRQPQVEHGEIAIVEIDGSSVTCKRVCYDYDNEKVILQPLNDKYDDMEYEADHIRILGKVVK